MTTNIEAKAILADAEKGLRDLMQRELRDHRYSEIAELAQITETLKRLASGRSGPVTQTSNESVRTAVSTNIVSKKESPKRGTLKKYQYPRFERDCDKLVKVGWSKKAREEYEHRAPRGAVLAFAEHLGSIIPPGRTFVIEELIPVHDVSGDEIPSYQVYLTLAWLRQAGVVEKKGRDGYTRVVDPLDGSVFDELWEELPERN
ncbi:MAG: hypothetical protein AB7N71_00645 [Phycisphaerae bacterium]